MANHRLDNLMVLERPLQCLGQAPCMAPTNRLVRLGPRHPVRAVIDLGRVIREDTYMLDLFVQRVFVTRHLRHRARADRQAFIGPHHRVHAELVER